MKTAKAILLNGYENEEIHLPINTKEHTEAIMKILDTDLPNLRYLSFGYNYLVAWQSKREERTSLELGMRAGYTFPQFIDSKVVIFRLGSKIEKDEFGESEEVSWLIDVDMNDIEEHFNTSPDNMFWTLIKS